MSGINPMVICLFRKTALRSTAVLYIHINTHTKHSKNIKSNIRNICLELIYLEISPQYHSASCNDMLLFMLLLVTVLGFGGLGGSAAHERGEKKVHYYSLKA